MARVETMAIGTLASGDLDSGKDKRRLRHEAWQNFFKPETISTWPEQQLSRLILYPVGSSFYAPHADVAFTEALVRNR
jgi:hypothetical protein